MGSPGPGLFIIRRPSAFVVGPFGPFAGRPAHPSSPFRPCGRSSELAGGEWVGLSVPRPAAGGIESERSGITVSHTRETRRRIMDKSHGVARRAAAGFLLLAAG